MKNGPIIILLSMVCGLIMGCNAPSTGEELLLVNPDRISELRISSDALISSYRSSIMASADDILKSGQVYSVNANEKIPPSGTRHDYYSTGPYWWPDPDSPNGLPYIRRDGQFNPERDRVSDRDPLHSMIEECRTVALAYALTGNERYAEWGTKLLRVWFLDEATRMNPNLNHAQAIPGVTEGRGTGVIDTHPFVELIDAILILRRSNTLSGESFHDLKDWFGQFTLWLESSENGLQERNAVNNHGTAYDMQYTALLWFVGRHDDLKAYLQSVSLDRIAQQISADGTQPLELSRTRTWSYCTENLEHFFHLALIAKKVGIDLFHFSAPSGGGLEIAMQYLLPYVCSPGSWPHRQDTAWQEAFIHNALSIASGAFPSTDSSQPLRCLQHSENAHFAFLLRQ